MAQVTVELRNLLKTNFKLFDFDYHFDDKNFAKELEQAVIDHYYNYEIGQEVPDDFKRVFKRRWLQAMSYYNQLHNTTLLKYNPLINHKMSEAMEQLKKTNSTQDNTSSTTSEGQTDTTNSDSTRTTDNRKDKSTTTSDSTRTDNLSQTNTGNEKASDYPQQAIAGGDYLSGERTTTNTNKNTGTQDNTSMQTAEGTSENTGTSSSDSTGSSTNKDSVDSEANTITQGTDNTHYEKTIEGLTGTTYQDLIMKERENMLRISGMLIEELKPCFILVH